MFSSLSAMESLTDPLLTGHMNTPQQPLTLVLGATGKTGRRITEQLSARGANLRLGSRSGVPPFDWDDDTTWRPILEGVRSMYLVYYPDVTFPGALDRIRALLDEARTSGVRHVVFLSGRGEEEAEAAEEAVQASGLEWTILRCSFFAQNFSEHFLLDPVLSGELAFPAGDVAEPFVDVDDIADVAVAALTEAGHTGRLYELTGPRTLTFAEAVAEISAASGREVRYVPITSEQFVSAVTDDGVPADYAHALAELFSRVLDGRNAYVTDGVQEALGRAPRDFGEYARRAAETGIWAGAPAERIGA